MSYFSGTSGADKLRGTATDDQFLASQGGDDTILAGDGDDLVNFGTAFTSADKIDGGAGFDEVDLYAGNIPGGLFLTPDGFTGVEALWLTGDGDYAITVTEVEVRKGESDHFTVDGERLHVGSDMTIDLSSVTQAQVFVRTGAGNDRVWGGTRDDFINLEMGGDDRAWGGAGNDTFRFYNKSGHGLIDGGAGDDSILLYSNYGEGLTRFDTVVGGKGYDTLELNQSAEGSLTLGHANLAGVERIVFVGDDMQFKFLDDATDSTLKGHALELSFERIGSGRAVSLDFGVETDTRLNFVGGSANEWLRGGALNDTFRMTLGEAFSGDGGADTILAGAGDDTVLMSASALTAADHIDGGTGQDKLELTRGGVTLGLNTVTNIEEIVLNGDVNLTFDDTTVAAKRELVVRVADGLNDAVRLDGSQETDGAFKFYGGTGDDTVHGGARSDLLVGGEGSDLLTGGAGADTFLYSSIGEVFGAFEAIFDLSNSDFIDLRGIDANEAKAGNQQFKLVDEFSHKAGQAMLFYDAESGQTVLNLDVDGDGNGDGSITLAGDHRGFSNFLL